MGEWSEYFEDFPEENPGNYVNGNYDPKGAEALRAAQAKLGTYQESCPLGVLELCTFKQLTSICALGSS